MSWGGSWGSSWGSSWGDGAVVVPVVPDSVDPDTALSLITDALLEIRVLDENETPSPEQSRDGLRKLNQMLEQWSLDSIMTFVDYEESFPLVAGQASYTIGENGDFATARPNRIIDAWIRNSHGYDTLLDVVGTGRYSALRNKNQIGFASQLHYTASYPRGVIRLANVPQEAGTLFIVSNKALTQFASLYTHFSMPPGYKTAIVMNLAVRLAPGYHKQAKEETKEIALSTKADIRRLNLPEVVSHVDPLLARQGAFNIFTGGF